MTARRRRSRAGSLIELAVIVAIAIAIEYLIQAFIVKPYKIPSGSMEPTLAIGQRVLADRIGMRFGDPDVGDIIVFHPPAGADEHACGNRGQGPIYDGPRSRVSCARPTAGRSGQTLVKRVVAVGGDRIAIRDGHVVRNGRAEREPFARPCGGGPACNLGPIAVPASDYFMMGDNRGQSFDSRFWGPVPKGWIIRDAFATYWPPDRIGIF